MIDKKIMKDLELNGSGYSISGLISLMERTSFNFIHSNFYGLGFAAVDTVYVNTDRCLDHGCNLLYFAILHEIAHCKRIQRIGKEAFINMLSMKDSDKFYEAVLTEELIADRYASSCFFKLNNKLFPRHLTQGLDSDYYKKRYRQVTDSLFGLVEGTEESYNKFVDDIVKSNLN